MGKKIVVITDMDNVGSGYKSICVPLLSGLAEKGHEIKVAGIGYMGAEHTYPFSVIPAPTAEEAVGIASNLIQLWWPDIILVALDLPLQAKIFSDLSRLIPRTAPELEAELTGNRKFIAITPLENGPLTMSWAAPLYNMDAVFFISELGTREANKVGVNAQHLQIGIDFDLWRPASAEEKAKLRNGLNLSPQDFVILTVADNQERKNLWAGMAAVSLLIHEGLTVQDILDGRVRKFPKTRNDVKYIVVTREQNPFGWRLRDLAMDLDINLEYMPFERGVPQRDLWGLYAVSDVYLQPSKAEGLCLPIMDAMGCGIPVVATDTGAMHELLRGDDDENRGWLVNPEYTFIDVWGNSKRDMINVEQACAMIDNTVWNENRDAILSQALRYIRSRTWDISVNQVDEKIKELFQ